MAGRYKYRRMTPDEMREMLNKVGMGVQEFCRNTGYGDVKVRRMLRGEEDIPHQIALMLSFLAMEGGVARAKAVTDAMIIKEE